MEDLEDYCQQQEEEGRLEFEANDPVHRNVRYAYFTSKSKGRGRKRRNWKEIELVSYRGGPFMLWKKFPFDVYATEVLGDVEDAEKKFIERIRQLND